MEYDHIFEKRGKISRASNPARSEEEFWQHWNHHVKSLPDCTGLAPKEGEDDEGVLVSALEEWVLLGQLYFEHLEADEHVYGLK